MTLSLINQLPQVRGQYRENIDLSRMTWFRVGGQAQVVYKPADPQDLSFFLSHCPKDIPLYVLGVGSNLLVRDEGVEGVVIRLGRGFHQVFAQEDRINIGAGCLDTHLAHVALHAGIGGLEFFSSIPGSVGGALAMNAGCYGTEVSDVLDYAIVCDPQGKQHRMTSADIGHKYRTCGLEKGWIFIAARFKGYRDTQRNIQQKCDVFQQKRVQTQPIRTRTGGSTFKNPVHYKAWELIDQASCRGLCQGDAQVSEKHCNFLINKGKATAQDLEMLAETVQKKVFDKHNIQLDWEIQRWGNRDKKKAS